MFVHSMHADVKPATNIFESSIDSLYLASYLAGQTIRESTLNEESTIVLDSSVYLLALFNKAKRYKKQEAKNIEIRGMIARHSKY